MRQAGVRYIVRMLEAVEITNFKGFDEQPIPLRPTTIIVGENNAGKSTLVEALRLVSIVSTRLERLTFHPVPKWLDIPKICGGVSPSLEGQNLNFKSLFHHYRKPPARINPPFPSVPSIHLYHHQPRKIHPQLKH